MRNATTDFLIDTYSVNFSGNLKVDGAPVSTGSPFLYPFGNTTGPGGGPVEASFFFDTTGQTVNVTSSYNGEKVQIVATGGAGTAPPSSDPAYWSRVNNLSSTINSIAINLHSYFETTDGGEYDFTLASINATNIVNSGTALAGKFNGKGGTNGAIQFGTLAGTATLQSGGPGGLAVTPYPADTGAQNTGMSALYKLGYAVTATITTTLDETGLATPKVAVTQGIAMNGSKITGLAAGTNATDAVNKAQLDAAIAGAGGGGSAYVKVNSNGVAPAVTGDGAIGIGGNVSASGQNALAIGSQSIVSAEGGVAIGGDSGADPNSNGARAELYATSIGTDSNAGGTGATAIGAFANSVQSYAMAIGYNSVAAGTNSTAIGSAAFAARTNSTAIGASASSTHANSTAVGAGAQTTAENQLVLGSSTTAVKVAGIDASTAAQQGPVDVVTVDASGTLGRQKAATAQSVQEVRVAMDMIAAVTDSQFDALSGTVQQLGAGGGPRVPARRSQPLDLRWDRRRDGDGRNDGRARQHDFAQRERFYLPRRAGLFRFGRREGGREGLRLGRHRGFECRQIARRARWHGGRLLTGRRPR